MVWYDDTERLFSKYRIREDIEMNEIIKNIENEALKRSG